MALDTSCGFYDFVQFCKIHNSQLKWRKQGWTRMEIASSLGRTAECECPSEYTEMCQALLQVHTRLQQTHLPRLSSYQRGTAYKTLSAAGSGIYCFLLASVLFEVAARLPTSRFFLVLFSSHHGWDGKCLPIKLSPAMHTHSALVLVCGMPLPS